MVVVQVPKAQIVQNRLVMKRQVPTIQTIQLVQKTQKNVEKPREQFMDAVVRPNSVPATVFNVCKTHHHFWRYVPTQFIPSGTRLAQDPHTFSQQDARDSPNRKWPRPYSVQVKVLSTVNDWTSDQISASTSRDRGPARCRCRCYGSDIEKIICNTVAEFKIRTLEHEVITIRLLSGILPARTVSR